ncbi:hypothetical protein AUC45_12600 [Erythrobacter sp. YT30]|nr:hypothetical protein AUC45_12600 [Erythrobacter sp. YT30]
MQYYVYEPSLRGRFDQRNIMSQQLAISSLFSAAALAALCALTAMHDAAATGQTPGAVLSGPVPVFSAEIN